MAGKPSGESPKRRNKSTRATAKSSMATPPAANPSAGNGDKRRATASRAKQSATICARGAGEMPPPEHHIRERAYFIYLGRDCTAGDPVADWLQAEHEMHGTSRS